MSRRDPGKTGERGQALLELALVTPILILLIMAIFQFAFVLESQMGFTNAVREAARRAAATTNPTATWVEAQLCANPACTTGLLDENVQGFNGARLTGPPSVTFCTYTVGSTTNYRVDVAISYDHPVFFGPIAFATDAVDGSIDGDWNLTASAQMRLERGAPSPVPGTTC